jgi:glycosyltransferase involved in cell wall biosynthesis
VRLLRRAAIVTAVSAQTAMQTARAFPGTEPRVVHNGLDVPTAWCAPRPPRGSRTFRVLYCGNWSRRKGVDLLEPLMLALGDGFELLYTPDRDGAVGGFPLPPNARSLGRLRGPAALAEAYRSADALVFPSRLEGLPLVPLEAMACGLPVVAMETSSVRELVVDGQTGFLVPSDDVAALAGSLRALRDSPRLWAAMSEAGRTRQAEMFSEVRMVEAYLAAYRDALAPTGA